MFYLTDDEKAAMERVAARFRALRASHELQEEFAARMGISPPTLIRMEKGDPAQAIGYWVRALRLLGRLEEFERLFGESTGRSLFEEAEQARVETAAVAKRPRARRRPRG